MTKNEKKILPELIDVAGRLSKSDQETLLRLGRDIIFINGVKANAKRG